MRLRNLKDAGSLIPQWGTAVLLNFVFIGLYAVAFKSYEPKPIGTVANACTAAIVLSLVLAALVVVKEIVAARAGHVAQAVSKGTVAGLNLSWAITCLAFLCYLGWTPISAYVAGNTGLVLSGLGAVALAVAGALVVRPNATETPTTESSRTELALAPGFQPTQAQLPTFQVTIADVSRLMCHQAGRAIGYAGSNVLFDDSFSLELDANERVARVYSNTNLVHTEDFLYWRLHLLMIGSAAEKVLTGSSSAAALDDLTEFDDVATKYLTLRLDRTFNAKPLNLHEAQIKASRISMLRKNVYDRCQAACSGNKPVLTELVKLMRTRSVLTYGDIRGILERVDMPEGFPLAMFDQDEVLHKALLSYDEHQEVTLEGSAVQATSDEVVAHASHHAGIDATSSVPTGTTVDADAEATAPKDERPSNVVQLTA